MKKIKLTIVSVLIAGFSYSQAKDTICSMVAGNIHFEFNYYTNEIIQDIQPVKNVKIKIKNNQILVLDLYDGCNNCNDNITERKITIYYKHKKSMEYFYPSIDNTIYFDGKEINFIKISKPNETK